MKLYTTTSVLAAYGDCPYGASAYNTTTCGTVAPATPTTPTPTPAAQGSLLTNTGFDIALAVTLAATIVFVALIVRFIKRPAR